MRSPTARVLGLAFAVTLAVAVIAGIAWRLLADGGSQGAKTPRSYHLEARLEVSQQEDQGRPPVDIIRAWYQAPGKSRWEFDYTDPQLQGTGTLLISDEASVTSYDGATNTYSRQSLSPEQRRDPSLMPAASVLLGPLPAASLDDFFASWGGADWTRAGEDQIAGRPARIYQLASPAGDVLRLWIDARYLFVLRFESRGSDSRSMQTSITATVGQVEYGLDVPGERFRFEIPEGAREVPAPVVSGVTGVSTSLGPIGGSTVSAPPGFLAPAYVPDGYEVIGLSSSQSADDRITYFEARLSKNGRGSPPGLVIEEQFRAGGLPARARTGTREVVHGADAYVSTAGAETRVVWAEGDIVITVRSSELSLEEMLRIAESMR